LFLGIFRAMFFGIKDTNANRKIKDAPYFTLNKELKYFSCSTPIGDA